MKIKKFRITKYKKEIKPILQMKNICKKYDQLNVIDDLNMNILPSYFILQAYRDKLGLELFKQQFNWFKKKINNLNINNI